MELSGSVLSTQLLHVISAIFWFIVVVSVVVFVHEFGHYYVAKFFRVKVEIFSIGFGPVLLKWKDKSDTEWRISSIPLGGYVKMFGDANMASAPDLAAFEAMNEKDLSMTFYHKKLWQKALIVAAGPAANYILAIILFAALQLSVGVQTIITPEITTVAENSPAQLQGLQPGDVILRANGDVVDNFYDLQNIVMFENGSEVLLTIKRGARIMNVMIKPAMVLQEDELGNKAFRPMLGIGAGKSIVHNVTVVSAISFSIYRTYYTSKMILKALGQILTGTRSMSEVGGPAKIAQYSAKSAEHGIKGIISIIAMISLNLGLINFLPIPLLDGGHLLLYGIQLAHGRPLPSKFLASAFRIGMVIVIVLMVVALFNDARSMFFASSM